MDFEPISDASDFTFGQGRGKSRTTVLAEEMLVACVEQQEQGQAGIELRNVGVNGEGLWDEKYYKTFYAALKTAVANLNVTVLRTIPPGRPHNIAITVKDRQAPPAGAKKAATKATAPAKKATAKK